MSELQTVNRRGKRESWAKIENVTLSCSPRNVKADENIAVTVGFQINGGIRRNFVRRLWEAAYDEHDTGFRLGFRVTVQKSGSLPIRRVKVKEEKFVRRAQFFWTRNPELPHRVWATVATEFETILYPKSETEAQAMLFDVTRSSEIPAAKLGRGEHSLGAQVRARWGKHIFTERGEANSKSPSVKVSVA